MSNKTSQSLIANSSASNDQIPKVEPKVSTKTSRLDQLQTLLTTDNGASIAEMTTATGWQAHSVRGAMAGVLKKRGLMISSEKVEGTRRYRASAPA